MGFARAKVIDGQFAKVARPGDHWTHPEIALNSTDANSTISIAQLAAGIYARSGLTVGRTDTTDTAANILASPQFSQMDIGDKYIFWISNRSGQTLTLAGGTGVTLVGTTTVLTAVARMYALVRTGAATFDLVGI